MIENKSAHMIYGSHTEDHRIDALNSPLYFAAVDILRSNPEGKVAMYIEDASSILGESIHIQDFINSGMIPSVAFVYASLASEGVNPDKITDFKRRMRFESFDGFTQNLLMVANRLHADFPMRLELHLEEHDEAKLDKYYSIIENFYEVGENLVLILHGNIGDAVIRHKGIILQAAFTQAERESEMADQIAAILSRSDVSGLVGHIGSAHSTGVSKKLKLRGLTPKTKFVHDDDGLTVFDPLSSTVRRIKDEDKRLPEHFWSYSAMECAVYRYLLDLFYSDYSKNIDRSLSIKISRMVMSPFKNPMNLDRFIEEIQETEGNAFERRILTVVESYIDLRNAYSQDGSTKDIQNPELSSPLILF